MLISVFPSGVREVDELSELLSGCPTSHVLKVLKGKFGYYDVPLRCAPMVVHLMGNVSMHLFLLPGICWPRLQHFKPYCL